MAGLPPTPGSPSAANRRADPRYVGKDLGTQCAHAGERWERPGFWSTSTPIHNATTFVYDRAEDLDDVVWRRTAGYSYSRAGSPTTSALERALSTLEGVEVTRVCGSGMAASHLAVLAAGAGKDGPILASSDVYGSVYTMMEGVFPALGTPSLVTSFADLDRLESEMRRVRPRVVYFEAVTNPLTRVVDAAAVIAMAHRHGARVIVDNTFTTPYLLRPVELGADLVTHSVSKFLSGHGDVLAGSVGCRLEDYDRLTNMESDFDLEAFQHGDFADLTAGRRRALFRSQSPTPRGASRGGRASRAACRRSGSTGGR